MKARIFTLSAAMLISSFVSAQTFEMVKDINPGAGDSYGAYLYFAECNGQLFFSAYTDTEKQELWVTDGTESGTKLLEINTIAGRSSTPQYMTELNDKVYMSAVNINGRELWVSDGTEAGTQLLKDILPGTMTHSSDPASLTRYNGKIYFQAKSGSIGTELWVTDGTEAGTVLLKDINPGAGSSYPNGFTLFDGKLYFAADDGTNGSELWVTDGTEAGTVLLKDINPGSGNSSPWYFTEYKGKLYFNAHNGIIGHQLWVTDGTEAGTQMVKDINPVESSSPRYFTEYNDNLYFAASDGTHGSELWVTDGTTAGTQMVRDINPSGNGFGTWGYAEINGKLYFAASDGTHGSELWVTDGTTAGTQMLKDINPGTSGSGATGFIVYNDKIYFAANDGTNGFELWESDGTAAGTRKIQPDIAPNADPLGAYDHEFIVFNGSLYLMADYNSAGAELWKMTTAPTSITNPQKENDFALYPNPTDHIIHIAVKKPTAFTLYDLQGKKLQDIAPGQTQIDMSNLASGIYIISDQNGNSRKIIKK